MNDDDIVPLRIICPKCGTPMEYQRSRIGTDQPEPYRIRIYFCIEHGFFRYSRFHPLIEDM